MAQPPILRPYEVVRAFEKFGWEVASERKPYHNDQRGSHSYTIYTKAFHRGTRYATKLDWQSWIDNR